MSAVVPPESDAGTGTVASRAADEIVARLERLPFGRFHFHLASILGIGTFFDGFDSIAISVALTVVFSSLNIGFVNAGLLIGIGSLGQFLGAVLFGYIGERYGRRTAFLLALTLFSLMSLCAAFAWSFESLLAIRLVQGLGLGGEIPVATTMFNEYVQGRRRGKAVGIYQSLFTWSLFVTPLAGALMLTVFGPGLGWRVLFGIGAFPVLVALYGSFRLPESARWLADKGRTQEANRIVESMEGGVQNKGAKLDPPEVRYRADIKPTRLHELFVGIYARRTALVWVQWFATFFVTYGYSTWLPTLFVTMGGLPPQRGLVLAATSAALTVAMNYVLAPLWERVGRKPLFSLGFALAAIGTFAGVCAVTIFHATGWPVLFGVALITALAISINANGAFFYTPELYPTRMRAWATAVGTGMNRLASFLAPIIVGALLGANLGLQSVFALFTGMSLIGLIVMLTLGIETKQRVLEELSI